MWLPSRDGCIFSAGQVSAAQYGKTSRSSIRKDVKPTERGAARATHVQRRAESVCASSLS